MAAHREDMLNSAARESGQSRFEAIISQGLKLSVPIVLPQILEAATGEDAAHGSERGLVPLMD